VGKSSRLRFKYIHINNLWTHDHWRKQTIHGFSSAFILPILALETRQLSQSRFSFKLRFLVIAAHLVNIRKNFWLRHSDIFAELSLCIRFDSLKLKQLIIILTYHDVRIHTNLWNIISRIWWHTQISKRGNDRVYIWWSNHIFIFVLPILHSELYERGLIVRRDRILRMSGDVRQFAVDFMLLLSRNWGNNILIRSLGLKWLLGIWRIWGIVSELLDFKQLCFIKETIGA
jgi:hypothetical protein